jgi:ATP-dependent Zn protease
MRVPAQDVHTAYHEAGHAALAHEFRFPVKRVSIIPDGNILGYVYDQLPRWMPEIEHTITPYREVRVRHQVMVHYAGAAAVAVHLKRGTWRGAAQDCQSAADLADHLTGSAEETDALLKWLWIATKGAMGTPQNRRRVKSLADALLTHRQLTAAQVRAVIEEADRQWLKEMLGDRHEALVVAR